MPLAIVATLSAAIGVAAASLAAPYGTACNNFYWRTETGRYFGIKFYPGQLGVMASTRTSRFTEDGMAPGPAAHRFVHTRTFISDLRPSDSVWNKLGFYSWPPFEMLIESNLEDVLYQEWSVPIWLVLMPLALPAGLWFGFAWRDRRRSLDSRCLTCGYDLRASPGRCPECGVIVGDTPAAR